MYNVNKITTSKRIIAFTLFISQVLTSCINFNVPSKQELKDVEKKALQQQVELEPTKKVLFAKEYDQEISSITLTDDERLILVDNKPSAALIVSQTPVADAKSSSIKREPKNLLAEEPSIVSSNQLIQEEQSVAGPKPPFSVSKHNELNAYRKQALAKRTRQTKVQTQVVSILPQIVANPDALESIIEELACLTFTAQGGHQLNLMLLEGPLTAVVDEQLFIGFSRPTLTLPVYVEPGFDLVRLKNSNKAWQQANIEVLFPERAPNGKGYVYIGKRGGMGGGNKGGKESSSSDKGGSDHSSSRSSKSKSAASASRSHPETRSSTSHTTSTTTTSSSTSTSSSNPSQRSPQAPSAREIFFCRPEVSHLAYSSAPHATLPDYDFSKGIQAVSNEIKRDTAASRVHYASTYGTLPDYDHSKGIQAVSNEIKRDEEASRQHYEWHRSPFSYAMETREPNTTMGSSSTTHTSSSITSSRDTKGKEKIQNEKKDKGYSIKVDGRELNPDKYVLNNPRIEENITKLYKALVQELGHSNFQFQVTGGDRYEKDGKVYSSTNHQVVHNAEPKGAHMEENGARAVDIRIKLADGSDIIPLEIVEKLTTKYTKLSLDYNALPSIYPNKHYHLQLPNTEEYGGGK